MKGKLDYSSLDESILVNHAKSGDTQSFEELVSRYRDRVYARAFSIMRNEDLAIDLSQNAWIKAWQRLEQFHGDASFVTWLNRIITNLCLDELRRQKRLKTDSIEEIQEDTGPVENRMEIQDFDPIAKLNKQELRERIDDAMDKLSVNHRTVLLLYEYEQLEYKQIADQMDTTIGTVMSRLFYARKKMASLLGEALKKDGLIE
ncbi:MAG: sigma-70 family RNA polymerase sigma factor [Verrucomicrobiota bacterium]|nr:sigma-70 family RNA polymerase sigma factor [Verrucomicrobiota bacterium]